MAQLRKRNIYSPFSLKSRFGQQEACFSHSCLYPRVNCSHYRGVNSPRLSRFYSAKSKFSRRDEETSGLNCSASLGKRVFSPLLGVLPVNKQHRQIRIRQVETAQLYSTKTETILLTLHASVSICRALAGCYTLDGHITVPVQSNSNPI